MGKRKLKTVPAALHSELSEYSSLLRALRTNDTLDLASQLLRAQPGSSTSIRGDDDGTGDLEQVVSEPNDSVNVGTSSNVKGRSGSQSFVKRKEKDNWTRWPLLTNDIHVPEFGFQDEVKALAMQALKAQQDSSDPQTMEDLDEETVLPQHLSDTITLAASSHLSRTLAALAAHTPPVEGSMQNRLKPFGWESVLEIVAVSGLADPKSVFTLFCMLPFLQCLDFVIWHRRVIEDVKKRMELIYGPSESHCQCDIVFAPHVPNPSCSCVQGTVEGSRE